MKALLLLAITGAALWLSTRSGCRHLDEDGRSLLVWTHREGRLRGWCPHCLRVTRGWDVPEPAPRAPRARKASAAELARLERQRQARYRLLRRLRAA